MAELYGVIINNADEPYVTGYDRITMEVLVAANRSIGRAAYLVVADPVCPYCGDTEPGWWRLDEIGNVACHTAACWHAALADV